MSELVASFLVAFSLFKLLTYAYLVYLSVTERQKLIDRNNLMKGGFLARVFC